MLKDNSNLNGVKNPNKIEQYSKMEAYLNDKRPGTHRGEKGRNHGGCIGAVF